jgi:hypothetical protein
VQYGHTLGYAPLNWTVWLQLSHFVVCIIFSFKKIHNLTHINKIVKIPTASSQPIRRHSGSQFAVVPLNHSRTVAHLPGNPMYINTEPEVLMLLGTA